MIVGYEWIINASNCDADSLRDVEKLRSVFAAIIEDLELKTIGDGAWHKFPGAGGVTGLVMLTESHLACHTYPEHEFATFNLYCCRSRRAWDWAKNLRELLGAKTVIVQQMERRGESESRITSDELQEENSFDSEIPNPKSKIAEGRA